MNLRARCVLFSLCAVSSTCCLVSPSAQSSDRYSRTCRERCQSQWRGGYSTIAPAQPMMIAPTGGVVYGDPCVGIEVATSGSSMPFASHAQSATGLANATYGHSASPPSSDTAHLRAGSIVETGHGQAVRLEVVCPGDTLVTVNGEATSPRGRTRYLDLPIPSDGRPLEYTVEGFVTRGRELMTFHPDTGKLVATARFESDKLNPRTYQLPRDLYTGLLLRPLVFRNDDRPRKPAFDVAAGLALTDLSSVITSVAPAAVTAASTDGFYFDVVQNTEFLRNGDPIWSTALLNTSPLVPVKVEYNDDGTLKSVTREAPAVGAVSLKFQGNVKNAPDGGTDTPTVVFNVYVDGKEGKPGEVTGRILTPALSDKNDFVTKKPKFNLSWTSSLEMSGDADPKTMTFGEALETHLKSNLTRLHGAKYLLIKVTLDFSSDKKKLDPVSIQNYIILVLSPPPK